MNKPQPIMQKNGVTGRQKLLSTFSIDFLSEIDGQRYTGSFTTKKLSIADLATIGVRKTQLNAGMHFDASHPGMGVDESTDNLNAMISHLDIALQEWPEWWNLDEITDTDLLSLVFEKVVSHENSFLRSRRTADRSGEVGEVTLGTSQDVGERNSPQADSGGAASPMVGEEVQAALEP